jgi:hypothetical protein
MVISAETQLALDSGIRAGMTSAEVNLGTRRPGRKAGTQCHGW